MSALILLTVFGILVLYLGFVNNKAILAPVAIVGLVATLVLSVKDWNLGSKYFHDMMIIDNFSIAFNVSMLIITILIFLFGINYYERMEHHVADAIKFYKIIGVEFTNIDKFDDDKRAELFNSATQILQKISAPDGKNAEP